MFSNNGKISGHQAMRLLIMDLFTGACLFLPMALSRVAGNGGFLSAVFGMLLIGLEGILMIKAMNYNTYSSNFFNKTKMSLVIRWMMGFRCLAAYIFLMGLFVQVLNDTFLYTMPKWIIISGMVAVLFYSGTKGIEVRARLSEILFYLSLIPIVFIGLFSLPEAEWSRLLIFDDMTLRGVFEGTLITWILMSPLEWLFYIQKDIQCIASTTTTWKHLIKIFCSALMIGGSLILFIYGTCQAVLGVDGMASERWPTTILMQIIKIPGGFLSRQDGLMLSFWIFAMYISLSGALVHTVELWNMEKENQKTWWILVFAAGGGIVAGFKGMQHDFLNIYFYGMIIAGIFIFWFIPLIVCIKWHIRKNKIKVKVIILTVHNEIEYLLKANDLNVDGYILKDSESEILKNAIYSVNNGENYIQPELIPLLNSTMIHKDIDKEKIDSLTKREVEVLKSISAGLLNKEIAINLGISERTVKNHISNIFKKINVADRTQAAVFAIKNNIVKLY